MISISWLKLLLCVIVLDSQRNMKMKSAAANTDDQSLPYHKKSDSEKDRLFKTIATQLDRIANDIELAHSSQLKTGKWLLCNRYHLHKQQRCLTVGSLFFPLLH